MKLLRKAKDGGPNSTVTGYWLIEWKRFFSIVLLRFSDGSRDEFHDHAFHSLNWILSGKTWEMILDRVGLDGSTSGHTIERGPGFKPVFTARRRMHRVVSDGTTWVLSIRGPWSRTWQEFDPNTGKFSTMTHGRKIIDG